MKALVIREMKLVGRLDRKPAWLMAVRRNGVLYSPL